MSKVLVFDVDDTISIHKNRDYVNAEPIQPVIDKLNRLYDEGYYIKLFTGRGQLSCNGDLDLIIERNKDVLETWLKKHGVKYHELIFGKPLGDWYIDDKGLSVSDFLNAEFCELRGGSNSSIRREYNRVIKQSKTSQAQYYWYRSAKELGIDLMYSIDLPHIYSCVGDTLYMDYIDGRHLCDCLTARDLDILVSTCKNFKDIKNCELGKDIDGYCDNLLKHLDTNITRCVVDELKKYKNELIDRSSFCHGDFTLSNIIKRDNLLVLFDPNYKKDYTSYLLDLSKIRQSLHDYEYIFKFSTIKNSQYLEMFDYKVLTKFSALDLQLVKLLDLTHWIRMYDYKNDSEKLIVSEILNTLYERYVDEYTKD